LAFHSNGETRASCGNGLSLSLSLLLYIFPNFSVILDGVQNVV
jgi:hypothetical protein